jgi:hypothetical protein
VVRPYQNGQILALTVWQPCRRANASNHVLTTKIKVPSSALAVSTRLRL